MTMAAGHRHLDLPDVPGTTKVEGYTDATACNFDASADHDDGTCTFAAAGLDCAGACLAPWVVDQGPAAAGASHGASPQLERVAQPLIPDVAFELSEVTVSIWTCKSDNDVVLAVTGHDKDADGF